MFDHTRAEIERVLNLIFRDLIPIINITSDHYRDAPNFTKMQALYILLDDERRQQHPQYSVQDVISFLESVMDVCLHCHQFQNMKKVLNQEIEFLVDFVKKHQALYTSHVPQYLAAVATIEPTYHDMQQPAILKFARAYCDNAKYIHALQKQVNRAERTPRNPTHTELSAAWGRNMDEEIMAGKMEYMRVIITLLVDAFDVSPLKEIGLLRPFLDPDYLCQKEPVKTTDPSMAEYDIETRSILYSPSSLRAHHPDDILETVLHEFAHHLQTLAAQDQTIPAHANENIWGIMMLFFSTIGYHKSNDKNYADLYEKNIMEIDAEDFIDRVMNAILKEQERRYTQYKLEHGFF